MALLSVGLLALTSLGLVVVTGPPAGATGPWVAGTVLVSGVSPAPATAPQSGPRRHHLPSSTSCIAGGPTPACSVLRPGIPKNGIDGLIEVGTLAGGSWSWTASTARHCRPGPPGPVPRHQQRGAHQRVVRIGDIVRRRGTYQTIPMAATPYRDGHPDRRHLELDGDHGATTGLSPPALATPVEYVWGVSCPSATSCVLAGNYRDTGEATDALIETGTLSGGRGAGSPARFRPVTWPRHRPPRPMWSRPASRVCRPARASWPGATGTVPPTPPTASSRRGRWSPARGTGWT